MATVGILIGSSEVDLPLSDAADSAQTPWGEAAELPQQTQLHGHQLLFLRRHGAHHEFAPHQINYRANLWLLHQLGADCVIGTHTVGAVDPMLGVGQLVLPDQLIDYTWGRESTYDDELRHIDLSQPYDAALRQQLLDSAPELHNGGVYACTQGPRLETIAEVQRLARDGATLVGMTGMPEAALARELELPFVSLCLVVNPAAGVSEDVLSIEEIMAAAAQGAQDIMRLIDGWLTTL